MTTITIRKQRSGEWMWNFAFQQVTRQAKGYTRKADARRGARRGALRFGVKQIQWDVRA